MSDQKAGLGNGILKGLKNLLFTPVPETNQPAPSPAPAPQPPPVRSFTPVTAPVSPSPASNTAAAPVSPASEADMKLKVYQLLEGMNKPGCDFFEVWNASAEMGGANATNIKAAFTSLRFADKTLTKAKLLETGAFYMNSLKDVLAGETGHRQAELARLDKEEALLKTNLINEIASLEKQIAQLQEKLAAKKLENDNIHQKFQPQRLEIETKIANGQQSVSSVLAEMQLVLNIINNDIN